MAVVVAVGTTVIATVVAMVKVAAIVATKTIKMATVITKIATAKIKINVAANVITIKNVVSSFAKTLNNQKSECSVYERNTRSFLVDNR